MGAGYVFCPSNKLTLDLLTLKVVSESGETWATYVPILVLLGLSVLDLGPMYATDRRQTSDRQTSDAHHRLMPLPRGRGIIMDTIRNRLKRWIGHILTHDSLVKTTLEGKIQGKKVV